jgi:peptidoglycan/LPS O-acetylase OafA/YrhL
MSDRTGGEQRNAPHLAYVDGLRALAALSVLYLHGVTCAFSVCKGTHQAWRYIPGHGIDLFFVISGLCLSLPYVSRFRAGQPMNVDWLKFMANRIARIAPPYYIVLGLLGLLALTPIGFPGDALPDPVPLGQALSTFARDLVFSTSGLQVYNSVFWTLGVEMRWYLVCPLLVLLYARSRSVFYLLIPLLYALYFIPPFGFPQILELGTLPCFMLGIVAADVCLSANPVRRYAWAAAPLILVAILGFDGGSINPADPLWHLLCFAIVVGASTAPLRPLFELRPLVVTGVASYSIYLVHLPIVWGLQRHGFTGPWAMLPALAGGFAFWWFVERPLLEPRVRAALRGAVYAALLRVVRPLEGLWTRTAVFVKSGR